MKTSILLVLFTLSSAIAKKKMTEQFGIANQAKKYSNYEAFLLATKNSGVKKLSMGLLKVAAIGVNTKSENSDFTLMYLLYGLFLLNILYWRGVLNKYDARWLDY